MTDTVREALEGAARTLEVLGCYDGTMHENARILAKQDAEKLREALSALCEKDDGWLPIESAPTLDRVIVAGWQPRNRNIIGYWWYHEDATDEHGKPMDYPSALLWRPFPAVPSAPPAAIRAGGDDVN